MVEFTRLPLVPLMVNVYVPLIVLLLVCTVRVDVPDVVTDVGMKLVLERLGTPLTLKLTVPVNELNGVTVTV